MTQKIGENESFSAADFDLTQLENIAFDMCSNVANNDEDLNITNLISTIQKPTVIIQTFRSDLNRISSMSQTLQELSPDYIVLYNANISAIRQIEIFESRFAGQLKRRLKVFLLMHSKTVEEQSFLTCLRREKRAFEMLIDTKRVMVVPEYQDGKSDVLDPHLLKNYYGDEDEDDDNAEEVNTRQAGGQQQKPKKKREKPRIIVDSREFRSELPCLIHKRGIDVVPAMISIGDYILTPDICVERKSISDLIGSLNSGRLYNQCQQMTRYYSKAILLIEFDQNRSFNFKGRYMISRETNDAEIMEKIQILTIHFPKLRLVWSPTPYATAQLFEELKQNRDEPDVELALHLGSDDPLNDLSTATEKYNTRLYDFLLKLPGINSKNIHNVMRKGGNMKKLAKMTEEELLEVVGNVRDAKLLHDIFHLAHKPSKQDVPDFRSKKIFKK
jgi:DNA excision repair protein ERCC-4